MGKIFQNTRTVNHCYRNLLFICFFASALIQNTHAQSISDTDDTATSQGTPPNGWTSANGTPDTSYERFWGFNGSPYVGGIHHTPPTGHSYFMSAGSWTSGEGASTTITGLDVGKVYQITFYVGGFRTPSYAFGDSYRIVVGNEDSGTVRYSFNGWIEQKFAFTADSSSETITLYGPQGDGIARVTHFSVASNAVAEAGPDTDGDGIFDIDDLDDDNDGILDVDEMSSPLGLDTDGDGIEDTLDLDSDGDGCPDAIEGAATFVNVNLVTSAIPGGSTGVQANLGNTVDTNPASASYGVPIIAGAGQGVGASQDNSDSSSCIDSDGDNIDDYLDLDDDNDGILDVNEMNPPLGVDSDGDGIDDANDFDCDGVIINTPAGNAISVFDDFGIGGTGAVAAIDSDNARAALNSSVGDFLVLDLGINVASGTIIEVESRVVTSLHEMSVEQSLDGTNFTNLQTFSFAALSIEQIQNYTLTADTRYVRIRLSTDAGGGSLQIDNVGYQAFSAAPCNGVIGSVLDTDGDGIADVLDLDSDGDGCPDAIEGGATFVNVNLVTSTLPGGSTGVQTNLGNNVDTNPASASYGVPIIAGAGQGIGASQDNSDSSSCIDSDGDNIDDYLDLDDDNDGILDVNEMNPPVGVDSDGDGIDDANDLDCDGVVTNTPASNAASVFSENSISGAGSVAAIGSDNSRAVINNLADFLVLDLGVDVISGTIIEVEARVTTSLHEMSVEQSADGTNFSNLQTFSFAALSTEQIQNYTLTADARYVRIRMSTDAGGGAVQVDNVGYQAFSTVSCNGVVGSVLDTDNDGIPNSLDLDSDGDGCPDAIEGGAGTFSKFDLDANDMLVGGVDTNSASASYGVPLVAGSGQSIGDSIDDTVQSALCTTGDAMITQTYHSGTHRAIEITNIHATASIPANALRLSLFNSLGDKTGIVPTATYQITGALLPGQSALVTTSGFSGANIIQTPIQEANTSVTSFDGGDDIIILSKSTDNTAWVNRIDVIESFSDNTSYVRMDEVIAPNTTFAASEWVAFVDDTLDPYRDLASGGPERHPNDPLLSEVNTPNAEANNGLGLHRIGVTTRFFGTSVWSNGYPDRTRSVLVFDNYNHTGSPFKARKLSIVGAKMSITDDLLVVTDDINIGVGDSEIRLIGTSQLVQTHTGATTVSGAGKLLVDQNSEVPSLYRYNYFSSPVNSVGQTNYTVSDVMKDGTSPTSETSVPLDINFVGGLDGTGSTTPISLAEYWIYTYGTSAAWVQKLSGGSIPQTDGFIFKGPGQPQNYTFVGTPKDGTMQTTVVASTSYLVGNPYSSAIRASKFIEDNLSSITGTLYFWEQKESINGEEDINGHFFGGYVGGYGIRNIAMGLAANNVTGENSSTGMAGLGQGTYKEPAPYIAMGQGFFVGGSATGGTIEFNNSQREYILEGSQSILFRNAQTEENPYENTVGIKLGMNYINEEEEYHRQIGISFLQSNSFGFEKGYDSPAFDLGATDIYWDFPEDDTPYFIAGVGQITSDLEIPLSIIMDYTGEIELTIDELSNIEGNIYLTDLVNGTSSLLSDEPLILNLSQGEYKERFYITFSESILSDDLDITIQSGVKIYADQNNSELVIEPNEEFIPTELIVYDILGKQLEKWNDLENRNINGTIRLKLKGKPQGIYLIKLKTNKGTVNKKVYLNFN